MRLAELLAKDKKTILERCASLFLEAYPQEATKFLRDEKDPFVNPIGHTLSRELEKIFDGLVSLTDLEELETPLDAIIRIQAVQEFSPSEALAFLPMLKRSIREHVADENTASGLSVDLLQLESRMDDLLFRAFDKYMECREKINEIRLKEARAERERLARVIMAMGGRKSGER
jgi:hypothetical protein